MAFQLMFLASMGLHVKLWCFDTVYLLSAEKEENLNFSTVDFLYYCKMC